MVLNQRQIEIAAPPFVNLSSKYRRTGTGKTFCQRGKKRFDLKNYSWFFRNFELK